jgi:hypothetical protein
MFKEIWGLPSNFTGQMERSSLTHPQRTLEKSKKHRIHPMWLWGCGERAQTWCRICSESGLRHGCPLGLQKRTAFHGKFSTRSLLRISGETLLCHAWTTRPSARDVNVDYRRTLSIPKLSSIPKSLELGSRIASDGYLRVSSSVPGTTLSTSITGRAPSWRLTNPKETMEGLESSCGVGDLEGPLTTLHGRSENYTVGNHSENLGLAKRLHETFLEP